MTVTTVHARTQGRPTAPVPFGNPVGRAVARRREIASHIQVTARHPQPGHTTAYPGSQRRPTAPVPFGDVAGLNATCRLEKAPRVKVSAPEPSLVSPVIIKSSRPSLS